MTQFGRHRQPGASLAHHAPPRITRFEPIPAQFAQGRAGPFRMDLSEILSAEELREITDAGSMAFHCIGDSGGVKDPEPQRLVERGMEQSLQPGNIAPSLRGAAMSPAFCYHLGDVVYYNGEVSEYFPQFYEPYEHPLPIVAIPGNHDGEPATQQATSLEGFYRNFPAERPADEAGADRNKALIVAVHHPIYSFDSHHSGSPTMAKELEDAINTSRRVPNMVLNAHVHNYQRIERTVGDHLVPFLVIGNGGYWNLHHLSAANGYRDPETEAALIASIDSRHGFMTFEISGTVINGHFTTVPRPQESWTDAQSFNASFDVFSYSSVPAFLKDGETVQLVPADGSNIPPHTDHNRADPPPRSQASERRIRARHAHAVRTAERTGRHRHA
jgi:hypothetical protein